MSALVFLETFGSISIPITKGRVQLQHLAKHWHYVMRSRRRWIYKEQLRTTIEDRAKAHLKAIGVDAAQLQEIADKGVVQVSVPSPSLDALALSKDDGWESRLIPWEYLLNAATRKYRTKPLAVVRRLRVDPASSQPPAGNLSGLFVDSAPGPFREAFSFEIEKRVLKNHLSTTVNWGFLTNPSLEEIQQRVLETNPHVIHVTG